MPTQTASAAAPTVKGQLAVSRIVDAAAAVILTEGIENLSMDRVAKQAGVSKGAVMHHFKSKRALLSALLCRYAEHLNAHLEDALASFEAAPEDAFIPAYIDWFRRFEENNHGWADVGLSLLVQKVNDPELLAPVRDWYRSLYERLDAYPGAKRTKVLFCLMAMEGLFFTHKFGLDLVRADDKARLFALIAKTAGAADVPRRADALRGPSLDPIVSAH